VIYYNLSISFSSRFVLYFFRIYYSFISNIILRAFSPFDRHGTTQRPKKNIHKVRYWIGRWHESLAYREAQCAVRPSHVFHFLSNLDHRFNDQHGLCATVATGVFGNHFFQCSDSLVFLSLPVAVIAVSRVKFQTHKKSFFLRLIANSADLLTASCL